MLDFNNIDIKNIARNWFTDFNDLILDLSIYTPNQGIHPLEVSFCHTPIPPPTLSAKCSEKIKWTKKKT